MPSELMVETTTIQKIHEHPNADRLEIATVKGWQVVIRKGEYTEGQLVVYFPIDSVLPPDLEAKLFPEGSKITLSKHRIKTAKIRGVISQGMVAPLDVCGLERLWKEGVDVAETLGVSKYKSSEDMPVIFKGNKEKKSKESSHFTKYTSINHLHNFPYDFNDKMVVITEKLHGTNARYGWVPKEPRTLWKKIKLFFSNDKREFVYGSHNVQLKPEGSNVYWKIAQQYDLSKICRVICEGNGYNSVVIYGEIIGDKIQKNYSYGCKKDEQKLVVFDIKIDDRYIDFSNVRMICDLFGLETVPRLYYGYYTPGMEKKIGTGNSFYNRSQKVMEGVTIRTTGKDRLIRKYINPEYLLKDNTEWT